jgi:hypothetical protein
VLNKSRSALLSQRTTLVLAVGIMIGAAAGLLTYAARRNLAEAILAGGGAAGISVVALNDLID